MKKILVTAFEIFGGHKTNSSMLVLNELNNDIIKLILPVSYEKARSLLIDKIKKEKPDFVLSLGLSYNDIKIRIEKIGVNFQGASSPDNDGVLKLDEKISNGNDAYITNVNTKEILAILKDNNIPSYLSLSAGGYICNTAYYTALEALNKNALFVHLPPTKEEKEDGLELNLMVDAINLILNYLKNN